MLFSYCPGKENVHGRCEPESEHCLVLHVENFSYLSSWYLERKSFSPPVDKLFLKFSLEQTKKGQRGMRSKALIFP